MSDCLAILGRRSVGPNRASSHGKENECLFCQARHETQLSEGDKFAILSGHDAGATFRAEVEPGLSQLVGSPLGSSENSKRFIGFEHELYGKLPLLPPAKWLPHLPLQQAFIVDELAVWACGRSLQTGCFVWDNLAIDEVIRTLWERRIPIAPFELLKVFAAHGLPTDLHERFEARVRDGIRLLVWTKSRPALKKLRLESFSNIDRDPRSWFDTYILPGLESRP